MTYFASNKSDEFEAQYKDWKVNSQFQCEECLQRFVGIEAVNKHQKEKQHHSFKNKQATMSIGAL